MVRVQPIGRTHRIAMHKSPPPLAGGTIAHEAHVGPPLPGPMGPDSEVKEGLHRQAPSRVRAWPSLRRNSCSPGDRELVNWSATAPSFDPVVGALLGSSRFQRTNFCRGPRSGLVPKKGTAGIKDIMYSFYRLEQGASLEDGTPRRRVAIKRLPLEAPVAFAPWAVQIDGRGMRVALCTYDVIGGCMVHVLGLSPRGLSPSSQRVYAHNTYKVICV